MKVQTEQRQAEWQLDEVRKEIKSEKLEAAKTEAKAAFVAKVGSLFGGGKLKEFEHRNEDLQKRIQELVTDFVKRYFPYVEKLMPTIKFLRDTLNFGDAVIRKLCTFKDVSIKGELYSREFNQYFRTDGAVCSIKQDTEGKFDFKIDGVSHVSWFRRKKDEFMKALGVPTRKQDKGIRL